MSPKNWFYTLPLRLRSLFQRNQVEEELSEEFQYHLEQKTKEYAASGMAIEEARRKARREFGGIEQSKENCRDTRRVSYIQDLLQDLGFGLRMLRNSPAFALVAILTLALGIGANTAIFELLDAVRMRSLPVPDAQRLVEVRLSSTDKLRGGVDSWDANIWLCERLGIPTQSWTEVEAFVTEFLES